MISFQLFVFQILILVARKLAKINRQSEYIITTKIETLSEKLGGDGYVGKIRESNMKGTAFTLYDDGITPDKFKKIQSNSKDGLRRELMSVIYVSMRKCIWLQVKGENNLIIREIIAINLEPR